MAAEDLHQQGLLKDFSFRTTDRESDEMNLPQIDTISIKF